MAGKDHCVRMACAAVLSATFLLACAANAASKNQNDPTSFTTKPKNTELLATHHQRDVIIVKFNDDLNVLVENGRLTDEGTGDLAPALATIARYANGVWSPMHKLPPAELDALRIRARDNLRKAVSDLTTVFHLKLPRGTNAATACDAFNALAIVDLARPAPRPLPPPVPPDFEPMQGYLDPATAGMDAECMWNVPGGTGVNVAVCDLEYSWNFDHEDLPAFTLLGGTPDDPFMSTNHGTAVLGMLAGENNGVGVTGIAYDSPVFVAAAVTEGNSYNLAGAITTALATLVAGDFILIEQQAAGPNFMDDGTQFGLVPSEWDVDVYNAIVVAVGNGVTVVEAAGNGSQDLDGAEYNAGHAPFLLANDSGAIIVGGGNPPGHPDGDRSRRNSSCYGATVDCQGIGTQIVTTGYGDLYNAEGINLWFTDTFSGTSSSSPLVCGAGMLLQSSYFEATGTLLTPAQIRQFLIDTGSPQLDGTNPASEHIGPRPNAAAAFATAYPAGDTNANLVPDQCDPDCNGNMVPDDLDIANGTSEDCNNNGIPDECDIALGTSEDCNANTVPDECDIAGGASEDCNGNGVPDECDIAAGTSEDCNNNLVPDECDILSGFSQDCQTDGIPDECQLGNCLNQYPNQVNAYFSDLDCNDCGSGVQILADQFVLSAGSSIVGFRWWGAYYFADEAAIHDRFTIEIRPDNAGEPGAAVTYMEGPFEADLKLDSGVLNNGVREFEYTHSISGAVALGAGTWWVIIYNDTSTSSDSWGWSEAPVDPVNGIGGSMFSITGSDGLWNLAGFDRALQVYCGSMPDNDCNNNGIPDDCEITAGGDCNLNGILDVCETKPDGDPSVAVEQDECVDAMIVCPGFDYDGNNLAATTTPPFFCGVYYGQQDVFYRYRPAYDGTLFVRVEGPPIYWLYAIYEGCPNGSNEIKCNETDHFQIVIPVEAGVDYYIRIASWGLNPAGAFEMNLVGPECALNPIDLNGNMIPDECECLADVNNSGTVDMADAMLVAAAQGTNCAACPEDVNGDGVVDATDWAVVLNSFGPCPFP